VARNQYGVGARIRIRQTHTSLYDAVAEWTANPHAAYFAATRIWK
jgi:hypothetical protein